MLESAEVLKVATEVIHKHLTNEYDAELAAVEGEILSYANRKGKPSVEQSKRDAANMALANEKLSRIREKSKYVGKLHRGLGNLSDIIVDSPG